MSEEEAPVREEAPFTFQIGLAKLASLATFEIPYVVVTDTMIRLVIVPPHASPFMGFLGRYLHEHKQQYVLDELIKLCAILNTPECRKIPETGQVKSENYASNLREFEGVAFRMTQLPDTNENIWIAYLKSDGTFGAYLRTRDDQYQPLLHFLDTLLGCELPITRQSISDRCAHINFSGWTLNFNDEGLNVVEKDIRDKVDWIKFTRIA